MKIDWEMHEGFEFAAMSECGDWMLYREKPDFCEYHGWKVSEGQDDYDDCELIFNDDEDVRTRNYKYAYDYKNTLVEYPNQPDSPKDVVYISGPMTGYTRYNADAFYKAEEELKAAGYGVINPVRIDEEFGFDPDSSAELTDGFKQRVRSRNIELLNTHATHIYMLAGWTESRDATAEYHFALWAGIKPLYG